MTAVTLADVNYQIKLSNQKLKSLEENSKDTLEYLDLAIDSLKDGFNNLSNIIVGFSKGSQISKNIYDNETGELIEQDYTKNILSGFDNLAKIISESFSFEIGHLANRLEHTFNQLDNSFQDLTQEFSKKAEKDDKNNLKEIEKEREEKTFWERLIAALEAKETINDNDKLSTDMSSFGGWVKQLGKKLATFAVTLGVLVGVFKGWVQTVTFFIKPLLPTGLLTKAMIGLGKKFTKIAKNLRGAILGAALLFNNFVNSLSVLGKSKAVQFIVKAIRSIGSLFSGISQIFVSLLKSTQVISKSAASIGKMFGKIGNSFRAFGGIIRLISVAVARIFQPIFFIYATFKSLQALMAGFAEGGILKGLSESIKTFFNILIYAPLDMLKDGVAWILDKFGFENAAEVLRSFSFVELFNSLIDGIFGFIGDAVDWVKNQLGFKDGQMPSISEFLIGLYTAPFDLIKDAVAWILDKFGFENAAEALRSFSIKDTIIKMVDAVRDAFWGIIDWVSDKIAQGISSIGDIAGNIGDMGSNLAKSALRSTLPDPGADRSWYNPLGWAAKAIPNSVYEFAGMDPKTGEYLDSNEIRESQSGQVAVQSGNELDMTARTRQELEDSLQQQINNNVVNSNSTNITNNATTVTPLPSSSRRPNNAYDTFFGQSQW